MPLPVSKGYLDYAGSILDQDFWPNLQPLEKTPTESGPKPTPFQAEFLEVAKTALSFTIGDRSFGEYMALLFSKLPDIGEKYDLQMK